jgi:hypothetical protein
VVPEPPSAVLLAIGLLVAGLGGLHRVKAAANPW